MSSKLIRLHLFLILLLTLCVYGQTVYFGYSLDDQLINEQIPGRDEGLNGIIQIFQQRYSQVDYRPIVILSYSLEKWLLGTSNPNFSHLINLLIFILILIAIYKTSISFLKKDTLLPVILMSLLIFCVHPIHVEVIANLKCRDNLLSLLFTVLSVYLIFGYFYKQKNIIRLSAGIFVSIIAIFSKLDAAGLVLFVPGVLFITKKIRLHTAFLFFVFLFFTLSTIWTNVVDNLQPLGEIANNNGVNFTENPLSRNFTITNRLSAGALTFCYYIKMLVIPFNYRYYYGFDTVKLYPITHWQSLTALASVLLIIYFIFRYSLQNRFLLICITGYVFFILYALNIYTPVAGIIADRYVFISSLFFTGCIAYLLFKTNKNQKVYYLVCGLIILILGSISFQRTTFWKDKLSLIEEDAPHLQNSYEAMRIAAATYIEYADKESITLTKENLLRKAIRFSEYGNKVYPNNVVLHKLQATAYFKLNKFDQAKKIFRIAAANDGSEFESHVYLGDIFYIEKNLDSAIFHYRKALLIHESDPVLINNISGILYEKGNKAECLEFNKNLINANDSTFAAWENLGYYYMEEKDTLQAVPYFEKAFQFGLQNPEAAVIIENYQNRKKQPERQID